MTELLLLNSLFGLKGPYIYIEFSVNVFILLVSYRKLMNNIRGTILCFFFIILEFDSHSSHLHCLIDEININLDFKQHKGELMMTIFYFLLN